ncbi:MAG: glycosyltransferase family 39 protein [Planctomycetota bacterium]
MILLTLVGALWCGRGLDKHDFWFDESCTFLFVDNLYNWPESSSLLVESTNLPYYFLLNAWVSFFGESETAYRSLSAVAAVLVIPVLAWTGRRLAGRCAGTMCALIVAFNPIHVYYAHEARAYALWTLVLAITLALLVRAVQQGTRSAWIAFGCLLFVALHVHYFTLFLLPALAASALLAADRAAAWRMWLRTTIVVGVAFVPYFLLAVLPAGRGGGSLWIGSSFEAFSAIPETLWAFLPAGGYPEHLRGLNITHQNSVPDQAPWLVAASSALPGLVMVGVVAVVLRFSRRLDADQLAEYRSLHGFLAATTLVPLGLALGYSVLVRPTYLIGRYDLVAWPAFVLWLAVAVDHAGAALTSRRGSGLAWGLCGLMVLCGLVPLMRMSAENPPDTMHKKRGQRVAELTDDGAIVVTFSHDWEYTAYYAERAGFAGSMIAFPSWLNDQVGWLDSKSDFEKLESGLVQQDAQSFAEFLAAEVVAGKKVMLMMDSLAYLGRDVRAPINSMLVRKLGQHALEAMQVDRSYGLWELRVKPAAD